MKNFPSARWHNLVMANYTIAPELLQNFLPSGVELDFWNGECYGEEPYETWTMSHAASKSKILYSWSKNNCHNQIKVKVGENLGAPAINSGCEFIIEHYSGYTKRGAARTDEYKVEHPKWELLEVCNTEITVDFAASYGQQFGFLSKAQPTSILLAKGSEILVYKGAKVIS